MQKKIIKKIIIIFLFVLLVVSLVIIKFKLLLDTDSNISDDIGDELYIETTQEEELEESGEELFCEEEKVVVDIKGAVNNPGVYEVDENNRVIDVINLAGGLAWNANTDLINLAKKVSNEMVIIIYTEEEIIRASTSGSGIYTIDSECSCPSITNDACLTNETSSSNESSGEVSDKVNINTATLDELQTLSGIGESKAEAIIAYREENGNFEAIEDIKNVSGIGDSVYEKIKDNITV